MKMKKMKKRLTFLLFKFIADMNKRYKRYKIKELWIVAEDAKKKNKVFVWYFFYSTFHFYAYLERQFSAKQKSNSRLDIKTNKNEIIIVECRGI